MGVAGRVGSVRGAAAARGRSAAGLSRGRGCPAARPATPASTCYTCRARRLRRWLPLPVGTSGRCGRPRQRASPSRPCAAGRRRRGRWTARRCSPSGCCSTAQPEEAGRLAAEGLTHAERAVPRQRFALAAIRGAALADGGDRAARDRRAEACPVRARRFGRGPGRDRGGGDGGVRVRHPARAVCSRPHGAVLARASALGKPPSRSS